MANYTTALDLYKIDPIADGNSTFNMETILNNNWDKIDTKYDELDNTVNQNSDKINQNTNITTVLGSDIGDKTKLKTIDKSNVVNAVNEVSTHMADIAQDVTNNTNAIATKENTLNTDQKRKISLSTTNPSDGSNGDIWIKYKS